MTIAAGLRCAHGVVLCADTQETRLPAGSKVNTPKLRVEPWNKLESDSPDDLMIAVAGAGDGPFIDKIVELAWEDVQLATSFDEACHQMEHSIKHTHKEYGAIFQTGYLPETQLVYGVKMHGSSKLFSTRGPIVNEKREYDSVGAGYYMADFLAGRMHGNGFPASQVITLAAYILSQCKEHVDGCGGESQIALLDERGSSKIISAVELNTATQTLRAVDDVLSHLLLLPSADADFPEDEFSGILDIAAKALLERRKDAKETLERWRGIKRRLTKSKGSFSLGNAGSPKS